MVPEYRRTAAIAHMSFSYSEAEIPVPDRCAERDSDPGTRDQAGTERDRVLPASASTHKQGDGDDSADEESQEHTDAEVLPPLKCGEKPQHERKLHVPKAESTSCDNGEKEESCEVADTTEAAPPKRRYGAVQQ